MQEIKGQGTEQARIKRGFLKNCIKAVNYERRFGKWTCDVSFGLEADGRGIRQSLAGLCFRSYKCYTGHLTIYLSIININNYIVSRPASLPTPYLRKYLPVLITSIAYSLPELMLEIYSGQFYPAIIEHLKPQVI